MIRPPWLRRAALHTPCLTASSSTDPGFVHQHEVREVDGMMVTEALLSRPGGA